MSPERWRQVEELYHAAREQKPDERMTFLANACIGDDELRREIESLLAQDPSKQARLDRPAWEGIPGLTDTNATATVLAPGTRLGPYKIEGRLGAGGMGEVFRAVDTRLGRPVAIKTSHEQFSGRFEREARAISALNHPNICTLYDVGPDYLVMELVEGETLAARLKKGALSLNQAVQYGAQIADALAAAHAKGITHRDLKPSNIMVTKSGVKVLDFGLAKSAHDETLTASRVMLGTPAYMAPEQRDGKVCDARTDIYALGLILCEMVMGKRTSQGQPAPLDALPHAVAHVIERCVERDAGERWQAASDVRKELVWASTFRPEPATAGAPPSRWGRAIMVLAGVALLGALGALYLRAPRPERRVQFSMPLDRTASADIPRIAPDGSSVVYPAVDSSGRRQLWLRPLDSEEAKPLPGTEDALYAFWSPDARSIGFYAQTKLKRISVVGGNTQTIASLPAFDGTAAWSSTGEILYAPGNRTALYRIPDSGGTPREMTKLDESRGENSHRWVRFLPDGKHFLFSARCVNRENNSLYSGSIESGEIRRLTPIQSNVAFAPPGNGRLGKLLFAKDAALYQQRFDGTSLSGEPVRLGDVGYLPISMQGYFDLSTDGRVLLLRPPYTTQQRLTWFDRKGLSAGTLGSAGTFGQPRFSPDGTRVIFNRPDDDGGNRDVWLIEDGRGTASRLTVNPANEWNAVWAPDGRRIAFASDRGGYRDGSTWEKTSMDPGAGERRFEGLPEWANPEDWSADGKWIAFSNGAVHGEIWIAATSGDRKPFRFTNSGFEDRSPRFSPDGKWIAYQSNETGHFEVYVRPFEGKPAESGQKIQISLLGGFYATWNRNGKELFFLGPDSKLYAVQLGDLGQSKSVPAPQALFLVCPGNAPTGSATQGAGFDVTPDGLKFLFACSNELPNKYTVTVNWLAPG